MEPSLRRPAGVIGIILGLIAYMLVIAALAPYISRLPVLVQLPVYLVLGIVWIFPLRPLLQWMETGSWKPPAE